jgi:hypothetical protein
MRTMTQVQAALVDSLADTIWNELSTPYCNKADIKQAIAKWMIDVNVRFTPRPTDIESDSSKE